MGIRVDVGGYNFQAISYSAHEEATPLIAGDSSGAVSSVTIDLVAPDEELARGVLGMGWSYVLKYGAQALEGKSFELHDSRHGYTTGVVDGVDGDPGDGTITLTCLTGLGKLAIYNIQSAPFSGTLAGAFQYYLALAGIENWRVDSSIADRAVAYPSWYGDLWQHLKMMAAAEDAEITFLNDEVQLRPIRSLVLPRGTYNVTRRSSGSDAPAQAVEVYRYRNRATSVNGERVYPPDFPNYDTDILTVAIDETAEYQIDLAGSVYFIDQPTCVDSVSETYTAASVYSVMTSDGKPVSAKAWTSSGGKVTVTLNPDYLTATVRIRSGRGLNAQRVPALSYSIARRNYLGQAYSTLRLTGNGTLFSPVKELMPTGIPASDATTDVGLTVDNPFLGSLSKAARAGLRAARQYSKLRATADGMTTTPRAWGAPVGDYEAQVFGNVAGARFWDQATHRWYRIRSADITPEGVTFSAEDDMLVSEMQDNLANMTYAEVEAMFAGMTYREVERLGLYNE